MQKILFIIGLAICFPVISNALCVSVPRAQLRSGPGKNFKATWTAGKYMPLRRVSSQRGWIQVQDMDNVKHWINATQVSESLECVVVKTKMASLRQGPGAKFPPSELSFADKYTPFRKVDRRGDWLRVEDDYKERFWIADSAVWKPIKKISLTF